MKISLFINPSFFFSLFKRPQLSYDETEQGKKKNWGEGKSKPSSQGGKERKVWGKGGENWGIGGFSKNKEMMYLYPLNIQ